MNTNAAIRRARVKRLRKVPHRLNVLSCHPCLMDDPGSSIIAATIHQGTAVCWTHALEAARGASARQSIVDELMRSGYWNVQ